MNIDVVQVPYDSGRRGFRLGAGPLRLVEAGLPEHLARLGHEVRLVPVELAAPAAEIAAAFALAGAIRTRVGEALERGALPLVLAGNCNSALGVISALNQPAVFWFDAHGDLNTPETTLSGCFDGMALSIALGRCWTALAARLGLSPAAEAQAWLLGARDLDPGEHEYLGSAGIHRTLGALAPASRPAYLHIDLDVLDPGVAVANQFAAPGGLSLAELTADIEQITAAYPLGAATLSAYDPAADPEGRMVAAAFAICARIAAVRSMQPD